MSIFPAVQIVDCDYYTGAPLDAEQWPTMKGARTGAVPIVRMFGVTEEGYSILVHVHCFTPYFYVQAPPNFTEADCGLFRTALNVCF
jgi:DNA polymerase delta subunit 1